MKLAARVLTGLAAAVLLFMPVGGLITESIAAFSSSADQPGTEIALQGTQVDVLLANSIFLALLTVLFALLLALPVAFWLGVHRFRGIGAARALCLLPLLIPPHIHTIAWTRVLGDRGWLTLWLQDLGWTVNIRASLSGADASGVAAHIYPGPAWVMACAFFPLIALPATAALQRIDREALDAGRLHFGWWGALRRVALPHVAPQLLTGGVAIFALALVTYPVVSLLDTPVLVQKVYFVFSQVDQGAGTILALPLMALSLLLLLVLHRLEARLPVAAAQRSVEPRRSPGAGWGMACLLLLTAGVPLISLLREAGPLSFGEGVDNYQSVFARTGEAFADSFLLVGAAVAILGGAALVAGRSLAATPHRLLDALASVAFTLPPMAVGVALLRFNAMAESGTGWQIALAGGALAGALTGGPWRKALLTALLTALASQCIYWLLQAGVARALLEGGAALPILGWLALYLPLCTRFMRQAFRGTDADAVAAARVGGLSMLRRFRVAEWPQVRGALVVVLLLAWVLCFTELSAVLLLLRPGWQFLQIRIFNMVHYQSAGEVAALCVLTIIATILPLALAGVLFGKREA